jgi:hypothetical protein
VNIQTHRFCDDFFQEGYAFYPSWGPLWGPFWPIWAAFGAHSAANDLLKQKVKNN